MCSFGTGGLARLGLSREIWSWSCPAAQPLSGPLSPAIFVPSHEAVMRFRAGRPVRDPLENSSRVVGSVPDTFLGHFHQKKVLFSEDQWLLAVSNLAYGLS